MNTFNTRPLQLVAALRIASGACHGRLRDDGTPALWHPLAVWSELLAAGITDTTLHAAALLHDVLEDEPEQATLRLQRIRSEVGDEAANIVLTLTAAPGGTTIERKAAQIARMALAPQTVRQVKLADRLANLRSAPPQWDSVRLRFYGAHTRALLAVSRNTHPVLEARIETCLAAPPWL